MHAHDIVFFFIKRPSRIGVHNIIIYNTTQYSYTFIYMLLIRYNIVCTAERQRDDAAACVPRL